MNSETMKKMFLILIAALMSVGMSASAGTKTEGVNNENESANVAFAIPMNIIVKQTIVFNDGKSIVLYYQKENDDCRLYSPSDITKYSEKDLERIKSTSFDVASEVKGKCYVTMKTKDVLSLAKKVFKSVK